MFKELFSEGTQTATLHRYTEGYYDENHQWVEPDWEKAATLNNADIQPRSGDERAAETGTRYGSDYRAYVAPGNVEFEEGQDEAINEGDRIKDGDGCYYKIVFVADWSSHYEVDLERIGIEPEEENNND